MNGFPQSKAEWDSYTIARASLPNGPCASVPDYFDKPTMMKNMVELFAGKEMGK